MLTDTQRAAYERQLAAAFQGALNSRELLALLGSPPDVANVPAAYWATLERSLWAAIEPIILEMAIASATGLGVQAGILPAVDWTMVNQRAASWASRYTFDLVRGVTDTTRTILADAISKFFRDGGIDLKTLAAAIKPGIPDLVNKLGQLVTSQARADMIAVTEVTRAAAQGEEALTAEIRSKNPNVRIVQIWLTSVDEAVCPICSPRHGKRRGDGWNEPPPAHPRCRCAIGEQIPDLGPVNA